MNCNHPNFDAIGVCTVCKEFYSREHDRNYPRFSVVDVEQKSEAWYAARIGRLTGSVAVDITRTIKSGEAASRRNLRVRLALERITGRSQESEFMSQAMEHGEEFEPKALAMYEANSGEILERIGFLSCEGLMAGCSLDAFVAGRQGIVEVKCPKSATHLEYLRTRKIPNDYYWQCVHNLWVSGARWCDFISYDESFPEELQYLCVRLERDEKVIAEYAELASRFLAEVTVEVNEIQAMRNAA
jgi:putative phage-type endonuclease